MGDDPKSVDISGNADLLKLAEEIRDGCKAIILRRGDEELAALVPVEKPRTRRHRLSETDLEAFFSAAGSWSNEQAEQFLANNRRSRDASMGRPVKL